MDAAGWKSLFDIGVSNIIKLNTGVEGSDDGAKALGMTVHYLPISMEEQLLTKPPFSTVSNAVTIMKRGGVFVHCGSDARTRSQLDSRLNRQGGQDRTGLICGVYRVWAEGWPKDKAYSEMRAHGFHPELHGLHEFFEDLK
jgi:hypothetical protein